MTLLAANQLSKRYEDGQVAVDVLAGVDFRLDEAELVGIYGASGAGKSTLLHILGSLDSPSAGTVCFEGRDLAEFRGEELARLRNRSIGFVFQFYHLLAEFTALENAMIPCLIAGKGRGEARGLAIEALDGMGLLDRADHRPAELSGGEQQRVALARASVMHPKVILADEPTGNLDRVTGERVWEHLVRLNRGKGIAMVVVSHNHELLAKLPRRLELSDGRLHDMP